MIDAGTIQATIKLDANPFNLGIQSALTSLSSLGIFSGVQGAAISGLGNTFTTASAIIKSAAGTVGSSMLTNSGIFSGGIGAMISAVLNAKPSMTAAAAGLAAGAVLPVKNSKSSAVSAMQEVGNGFLSGLISKQGSIFSKAASIAQKVASTIRNALKIASPSKVTRELGQFTGEGLALGIDDMQENVRQSAANVANIAGGAISGGLGLQTDFAKSSISGRGAALPNMSGAGEILPQAAGAGAVGAGGAVSDFGAVCRKLDSLISLLGEGRQAVELDGRTFARLIREYS